MGSAFYAASAAGRPGGRRSGSPSPRQGGLNGGLSVRGRAPTECDLHFKVELPALFRPAMRPIFAR
ncbi:CAP domain-containing protein, partial [Xanthomonas oryzae pv. oryzae]